MKEAGYPGLEIGTVDQFQVRTADYIYSPPPKKKKKVWDGRGGGHEICSFCYFLFYLLFFVKISKFESPVWKNIVLQLFFAFG